MDTMFVEDAQGNPIEVPVGVDGENPVSPNNPISKKALPADLAAAQRPYVEEEADEDDEVVVDEEDNTVVDESASDDDSSSDSSES